MTRIIADQTLRCKLNGLGKHVEIQDDSGHTVGHYLPSALYDELLYSWANAQFTDEEELRQVRAEPGGLTTAEVLAHLQTLCR